MFAPPLTCLLLVLILLLDTAIQAEASPCLKWATQPDASAPLASASANPSIQTCSHIGVTLAPALGRRMDQLNVTDSRDLQAGPPPLILFPGTCFYSFKAAAGTSTYDKQTLIRNFVLAGYNALAVPNKKTPGVYIDRLWTLQGDRGCIAGGACSGDCGCRPKGTCGFVCMENCLNHKEYQGVGVAHSICGWNPTAAAGTQCFVKATGNPTPEPTQVPSQSPTPKPVTTHNPSVSPTNKPTKRPVPPVPTPPPSPLPVNCARHKSAGVCHNYGCCYSSGKCHLCG